MAGRSDRPGVVPEHELKCDIAQFALIKAGVLRVQFRRDDRPRGFCDGDVLLLREWNPETQLYTGRELTVRVYYVLRDAEAFGLAADFCAMSVAFESEA